MQGSGSVAVRRELDVSCKRTEDTDEVTDEGKDGTGTSV